VDNVFEDIIRLLLIIFWRERIVYRRYTFTTWSMIFSTTIKYM